MRKKHLFILPIITLLCSCTYSSYLMLNGTKKITNKEISASYTEMDGFFARTFKVSQKQNYHFTFTSSSNEENKGSLSLRISLDKKEKNLYEGESLLSLDFSIEKEGKWEVRVIGDHHSGSFSLKWEKVALSK